MDEEKYEGLINSSQSICDEFGDEDDLLAQFIESEVLAVDSDKDDVISRPSKKLCVEPRDKPETLVADKNIVTVHEDGFINKNEAITGKGSQASAEVLKKDAGNNCCPAFQPSIEEGCFSKIPVDIFPRILKFLSSEDLVTCALVCRFLNCAASEESLWRRLYFMRWGISLPAKLREKPRCTAWKRLYIERDEEDMIECVRTAPVEFREYYIQMQACKRSQVPLPSQVNDDKKFVEASVSDRITRLKHSRGLPDEFTAEHVCSGSTCSYSQIGDAFVCEKTGRVHVCDDSCREIVLDSSSGLLVCTVSGRCFDRWLSPSEEEQYLGDQQGDGSNAVDEAEPFMGSGRFARAYLLGYNCDDEQELEAALAIC